MPSGPWWPRSCPQPAKTGRPWAWPLRHVLSGVLYMLRTGCPWEHLPHEFPPTSTMHRWFLRLCRSGVFDKTMQVLAALDRARAGRDPLPTAAVVDAPRPAPLAAPSETDR